MPFRIVNIHPGAGKFGETVIITIEYEPEGEDGFVPSLTHVLFHEHVEADYRPIQKVDKENHQIEIHTKVPLGAQTGTIQVDLEGHVPIESHGSFTVQSNSTPPRIVNIAGPPDATIGYPSGFQMVFTISGINAAVAPTVSFPRSQNGPPNLPATMPPTWVSQHDGGILRVRVPPGAKTGRVKIVFGSGGSLLSRPLVFA
jgi:hypothetical protein